MKFRAILAAGFFGAALAACADAAPLEPSGSPALGVSAQRTVYVDATTSSSLPGSGGYVKGWATSVNGGPGYEMGDVEANGTDGQYMLEDIGYTGQLDAFVYDTACTFKWYNGPKAISTAGTIYLSSFPNVSQFTLHITCP